MTDIVRNEHGQFVKGNAPKHPRNSKGKFIHGHKAISNRDATTGRFIGRRLNCYEQTRIEVDKLLSKEAE